MSSTIKSTKNGKSGKSKKSANASFKGTPNPIEYQLSNELFAKLGWTVMPTKRTRRKIVEYQTQKAKPHLDWFHIYRYFGGKYYDEDKTKIFMDFHPDGSGRVFYPNGKLAIEIRRSKKRKRNCLETITFYTVFTPGGMDIIGVSREPQITAIFDSMGNGMVMNEDGEIRLSYNQLGGVYVDSPAGIPYFWLWNKNSKEPEIEELYSELSAHHLMNQFSTRKNKPVNSSTGKNTPKAVKSSIKNDQSGKSETKNHKEAIEEIEKIEGEVNESRSALKRTSDFDKRSVSIKVIFLKINRYLCLRIHDRWNINLQFLAVGKSIRVELGTKLDLNEEIFSYYTTSPNLKEELLKCRFLNMLESTISDDTVRDLITAQSRARRIGNSRNFMISKYKPFLQNAKKKHFS